MGTTNSQLGGGCVPICFRPQEIVLPSSPPPPQRQPVEAQPVSGHNSAAVRLDRPYPTFTRPRHQNHRAVIRRSLWGRPERTQQQQAPATLNEKIATNVENARAQRASSNAMNFGVAPADDAARRRAEGKSHTPQEFLNGMAMKYKAHKEAEAVTATLQQAEQHNKRMAKNDIHEQLLSDSGVSNTANRPGSSQPKNLHTADQTKTEAQGAAMAVTRSKSSGSLATDPKDQPEGSNENLLQTAKDCAIEQRYMVEVNRKILDSLEDDLLCWYRVNVLCYDIRHFNVTIESRSRINNSVRHFSDHQRQKLYDLVVPSSIPNHVLLSSPNGSSSIEDGNVRTLEMLLEYLREMSVAKAKREGSRGHDGWKETYFKDLAPFFEYSIGIFDGGRQLENRLWFLELMLKYDFWPPLEELREWNDKMQGASGMHRGPATSELASLWREETVRGAKTLQEWVEVVRRG
ncbi:hypothetical protein IFR05_008001 [Cadophora sp. M221]|nr:hypothetical protein IFR05_008001 [Cadophora sp. M221]